MIKDGVSSKIINLLSDMYRKVKIEIGSINTNSKDKVNEKETNSELNNFLTTETSVLQGESRSLFLFAMFVNDTENIALNDSHGAVMENFAIKLLMFVDDMVTFSDSRQGLQRGLNSIEKYCESWGITVNTNKTKIAVFRTGGRLSGLDKWYSKEVEIEIVPYFKYLGLNFLSIGPFSKGIKTLVKHGGRALFGLKSYLHKNPEMSPQLQLTHFESLVILSYSCEVWGFCIADPIKKFHLKFLKEMLGVRQNTPTCFAYGELGVFPLLSNRKTRILKIG